MRAGHALDLSAVVDSAANGRAVAELDHQDAVCERLHGPREALNPIVTMLTAVALRERARRRERKQHQRRR
jgi:hypothetical protein